MRINAGELLSMLELDLEAAGWDGCLMPYPDIDSRHYAMLALRNSILKKFVPSSKGTTPEGDAKALSLFRKSNENCRDFQSQSHQRQEWEEIALGEVKLFLDHFFYPSWKNTTSETSEGIPYTSLLQPEFILSDRNIFPTVGCGPGASVGSKETDFYTKLGTSKLTFTDPSLHLLYVQAIRHHPTWTGCEIFRSSVMGERLVSGSRLSFVPKTSEISRCICTEPILNMFFQKGVQGALEKRLLEVVGIDLSNQPIENAELARIGSLSGKFGTIDLSSASDSLSLNVVREYFPRRALSVLERYRSPSVVLPDGCLEELHMISSMGNAFTFPLQTIFFSALVLAAYKVLGIKPIHFRGRSVGTSNFAVFGDDIIVENRAYDLVCRLLYLTGFTVNKEKSFNEGLFRESCGHDYYQGYNVRGVYIKQLNDANDLYSAINRLNRWSARHQVLLENTVGYLSSKCRFLPVPFEEDDSCGIKVPYDLVTNRQNDSNGAVLYRYSRIMTRRVKIPPTSRAIRDRLGFFENPDGLLMAFVAGYIRNGSVAYRNDRRRANIRKRYTPRWDYIDSGPHESGDFRVWWKLYTARNLGKVS